jgi:hypothetical protein
MAMARPPRRATELAPLATALLAAAGEGVELAFAVLEALPVVVEVVIDLTGLRVAVELLVAVEDSVVIGDAPVGLRVSEVEGALVVEGALLLLRLPLLVAGARETELALSETPPAAALMAKGCEYWKISLLESRASIRPYTWSSPSDFSTFQLYLPAAPSMPAAQNKQVSRLSHGTDARLSRDAYMRKRRGFAACLAMRLQADSELWCQCSCCWAPK